MSDTHRRRRRSPRASKIDVAIFAAGLIAAPIAGVMAYRAVGPYADGPLNVRLYRAEDPVTGRQLVYRDFKVGDGTVLRYFYDDATRTLTEIRLLRAPGSDDVGFRPGSASGGEVTVGDRSFGWDATGLVKTGFSLRGNGVIDAWEYRNPKGQLLKIEVSRRQLGRVDRWEFYEDEQLVRVEEDEDGNGRVDRWLSYESGILTRETRDRDGDGRPDTGR